MTMTCDEVRMSLGVYALGALEPDEQVLVEAHLAGCARCRAELEELAGVATFLGKVSQDDVAQVASPPGAVLDRLLSAGARRRRTTRLMLSLAASVLVVGLGGGTLWAVLQSGGPESTMISAPQPAADRNSAAEGGGPESGTLLRDPDSSRSAAREESPVAPSEPSEPSEPLPPSSSAMTKDVPSPSPSSSATRPPGAEALIAPDEPLRWEARSGAVRAEVTARAGQEGTVVGVVLTGAAEGTRYRLRVLGDGGLRETAAGWITGTAGATGGTGDPAAFTTTTTIPAGRITSFQIVTAQGRVLLTVVAR
ncbi:anti-sigma factor family protein [Streptosporangium sp. DT93]|uniref:anti-sigma factor family protein n=1 Tax=Streptosporangium sp. DT93 TaxID=3393428 RepID=UPI003CF860FE